MFQFSYCNCSFFFIMLNRCCFHQLFVCSETMQIFNHSAIQINNCQNEIEIKKIFNQCNEFIDRTNLLFFILRILKKFIKDKNNLLKRLKFGLKKNKFVNYIFNIKLNTSQDFNFNNIIWLIKFNTFNSARFLRRIALWLFRNLGHESVLWCRGRGNIQHFIRK